MSKRYTIEHLIEVVEGDRAFVEELFVAEIVERDAELTQRDVERVRVAFSLTREMGVNLAGVDVILRLREELMQARRELVELAEALAEQRPGGSGGD